MAAIIAHRERPLLMRGPLVVQTLRDEKTQTRRVNGLVGFESFALLGFSNDVAQFYDENADRHHFARCPYGVPGDRLWVRETWRTAKSLDALSPKRIADQCVREAGYSSPWAPIRYEADGYAVNEDASVAFTADGKTRVAIHMPRWASRLTLEITDVRVQRLQDISEEDARAEGVEPANDPACLGPHFVAFQALWDSINGKREGCSWDANPWVWALTFKRIDARSEAA